VSEENLLTSPAMRQVEKCGSPGIAGRGLRSACTAHVDGQDLHILGTEGVARLRGLDRDASRSRLQPVVDDTNRERCARVARSPDRCRHQCEGVGTTGTSDDDRSRVDAPSHRVPRSQ
jgi:hypothetical protein